MGMGSKPVQNQDRWAFGFLLAFLATIYISPGEWIPGLERWRPALLTSAIATGLTLMGRLGRREKLWVDGQRGVLLITFCGLVFASLGWSLYPDATRFAAVELLKWVLVYLTLVNLVTTERRLLWACIALILGSLVTSRGVIAWHYAGVDMVEGYRARWVGVYADPNRMAMSVGIIIPLAIAFFLRRESKLLTRVLCAAAVVLSVIAIVFSHSRGGFMGLSAAMAVWTLREKRLAQTAVVAMLALGMLIFAPKSFWNRTETVSQFEQDASAMGRVHAWHVTSAANLDKPLLGVGVGAFQYAWPLYAPPEARRSYAAHNVFLQVIAELGMIGMALFLIFIGGGTGGAFSASSDPRVGWLARALAASSVGYLICSLFAGFLASPHLFVLMGLAACAHRISLQGSTAIVPSRQAAPASTQTVAA
jgi:putative inorganic carbon (hco3(-)) transporter